MRQLLLKGLWLVQLLWSGAEAFQIRSYGPPLPETSSLSPQRPRFAFLGNSFLSAPSTPILLIHPVGIGLSSWFWKKLDLPAAVAPDLPGCTSASSVESVNDWYAFCMENIQSMNKGFPFGRKCAIVAQGGLAPLGVQLAADNPDKISHLILTSPPTYEELCSEISESELQRNLDFLTRFEVPAFSILESARAVRFFSNQFLFADACDDEWVSACVGDKNELRRTRRAVQLFNAGYLNAPSFQRQLESLQQPVLILQGTADKRNRKSWTDNLRQCEIARIAGQNVLPWENPEAVASVIQDFVEQSP